MGYWVYQREVRFRLAQQYHAVALAATKILTGSYSWVETERVLAAASLLEAFAEWRWRPETDHQGTITNIYHTGWKIGAYLQFFEAIAPWVDVGSFVRLEGEDGAVWHYAFDGLHAHEVREHPDGETSWRAVGAHTAFVAAHRGLLERLAGPVSALIDGAAVTPADGAFLAATDLDQARRWLRALHVALRTLPLFTALPTWSSWRMQDLVLLVADAWVARLHDAALAGTPERTASLGAMLAPLFAHPDLATCWTTVLQQLLAIRDGHHVRLAAANVIANLGMTAPVTLCTDLLMTPHAAGARIAALLAVWPHRERVDPQTILPALADLDATVVLFAIELLGGMGARMPREPLMALRTAPDSVGGAALHHTTAPNQEDDLSADQQRQLRVYRYLRQGMQGRGGPYWPATTLAASRAHRDPQDRVRAWQIAALPDNGVTDADLTATEPGRSGALLLPALLTRPVTHLPPAWIPVLTYAQPQSSEGRSNVTWAQTYGDRATFDRLLDVVRAGPPVDPAPWSTAPSQLATNFLAAVAQQCRQISWFPSSTTRAHRCARRRSASWGHGCRCHDSSEPYRNRTMTCARPHCVWRPAILSWQNGTRSVPWPNTPRVLRKRWRSTPSTASARTWRPPFWLPISAAMISVCVPSPQALRPSAPIRRP